MRRPCDETVPEICARLAMVERATVMCWHPGDRERVLEVCAELELAVVSSGWANLEITAPEASKGAALGWLCDHLGIPQEESVAFGDSLNDVSMLEAAGTGVAMSNASEEALAAANAITSEDCNAGGEGLWLLEQLE